MGRRIKICVADDEPVIAEVLCEGLRAHNFEAVEAHSGQEALDICKEGGIDLILLDINMPGMDGYEVCRQLKASPDKEDITVMFVTGREEPEDHEKGFDLGAVDYVTKPFNLPMLMVRVESALRMKYADEPNPLDTEGIIDVAYTDQLTGLRNQRYFLERLQEEVDKAHRYNYSVSCVILDLDGMEAVNAESGPVALDDLLVEVAMSIRSFTRSYDVLGRYDGTLFAALLPHTELKNALEYGTKIMEDIDATTFSNPNFPTKASMSVSAVTFRNGSATAADLVFGEAMRTLLTAKSQPRPMRIAGRNLDETS